MSRRRERAPSRRGLATSLLLRLLLSWVLRWFGSLAGGGSAFPRFKRTSSWQSSPSTNWFIFPFFLIRFSTYGSLFPVGTADPCLRVDLFPAAFVDVACETAACSFRTRLLRAANKQTDQPLACITGHRLGSASRVSLPDVRTRNIQSQRMGRVYDRATLDTGWQRWKPYLVRWASRMFFPVVAIGMWSSRWCGILHPPP